MVALTVIVPIFNGERHLAATLDSLVQQGVDLDVLVIDDGSTDGGAQIARHHAVAARVLTQQNLGVAAARNRGLAEATSRYVAFLDQDDLWHQSHASTLLATLRSTGAVAVAARERTFALESDRSALLLIGDNRSAWPDFWIEEGAEANLAASEAEGSDPFDPDTLTVDCLLGAPQSKTTSYIYNRVAAIAAGGCCPVPRALDDHILNLSIARMYGPIPRLGGPTVFYRVHPAATTIVSPLAGPYLTMLLALRYGRAFPRIASLTSYTEHLLRQLPDSDLSRVEQIALLTLVVPRGERALWWARWMKATARKASSPR